MKGQITYVLAKICQSPRPCPSWDSRLSELKAELGRQSQVGALGSSRVLDWPNPSLLALVTLFWEEVNGLGQAVSVGQGESQVPWKRPACECVHRHSISINMVHLIAH